MLRILFAIIFVTMLSIASHAKVCNIAQNINSPEQCELSGDSHCCQWGYWFQSFYCVETWCYSYNTCSWNKIKDYCYYGY